ncbi:hypothetical protein [Mucilaginibacter segetis]|uniref:Uncharacterized protein n=1 Tax=Mucilaginibacter segetis TaxID=2793071 RepID=A0A934PW60_9SPHI|nr:hypothetical protein [Mucilaginibacter segetis]MBK0380642.1 hypothetical protein [Mucilaginibacter segetis]
MRTSLNNIKIIDDYLSGCMPHGDALLFEAKMLLNNDLSKDVAVQGVTNKIIRQYGRQCLKAEIIAVQAKLAAEPKHKAYIQRIAKLFK